MQIEPLDAGLHGGSNDQGWGYTLGGEGTLRGKEQG